MDEKELCVEQSIVMEDIIVTLYTSPGGLFQSSFSLVLWTESPFAAEGYSVHSCNTSSTLVSSERNPVLMQTEIVLVGTDNKEVASKASS